MAQISYKDIPTYESFSSNNDFSFFSLKNNGDKAVVRILYDSPDDFKIISFHNVQDSGKSVRVNCLRAPNEPTSRCPFCSSLEDAKTQTRIYIPMIQYFNDEQGQVSQKLVIWDRSLVYARTLSNLINEYGPLSDVLFTIVRDGAAGSMDTKYNIMYCSPKVYPPESFPLDSTLAENARKFEVLGTIVKDKTKEDMEYFLVNNTFAASNNNAGAAQQSFEPSVPTVNSINIPNIPSPPPFVNQTQGNSSVNTGTAVPGTVDRPRRYY